MAVATISFYGYVKEYSGLKSDQAIERLSTKVREYMNKNNIKKITPEIVQGVKSGKLK